MDAERFEKLTASAQHIAVIVGLVVSGIWAGYRFILSPEAQHQAFLRGISTHPIPSVELSVPCIISDTDAWLVFVDARIRNASRSTLTFDTKNGVSVVSASLIEYTEQREMQLGEPIHGVEGYAPPSDHDGATQVLGLKPIGAGQDATLRYVLRVSAPGTYQLTFFADAIKAAGGPASDSNAFKDAVMQSANAFHLESGDTDIAPKTSACTSGSAALPTTGASG